LAGKSVQKRPLGRPKRKWVANIKIVHGAELLKKSSDPWT